MQLPTQVETLLEHLAVLDHRIELLQARLVAMQQSSTLTPCDDFEQTLLTLLATRIVLRERLEQVERRGDTKP